MYLLFRLPPIVNKGSPIFNLMLSSFSIITINLNWVPGNEKCIKIWEDAIMNHDCLSHQKDLSPLHEWMHANGIIRLFDIIKWDETLSIWIRCNLELFSPHLSPFLCSFFTSLQGWSLCSLLIKHVWGWGDAQYSIKKCFKFLQE